MEGNSPLTCLKENWLLSWDFYTALGQSLSRRTLGCRFGLWVTQNTWSMLVNSEEKGKKREKLICSNGRLNKYMMDFMFGFVTCLSQQCLARIGSSTEETGVYLSWDPAVPCPRSSVWYVLVVTGRYHKHIPHSWTLSPRSQQETENVPQGHDRPF